MRTQLAICSLGIAFIRTGAIQAQSPSSPPMGNTVPVTPDNFNRAESDLVMGPIVKVGGFGKYVHHRELYPLDAPIEEKVTIADKDHHTMEMWSPGPDGRMFKMMEIVYTRHK